MQHPGHAESEAEVAFVFDIPELIDEYLGGITGISGFEYTHDNDIGWVYFHVSSYLKI